MEVDNADDDDEDMESGDGEETDFLTKELVRELVFFSNL